jgi:hypothetical protein
MKFLFLITLFFLPIQSTFAQKEFTGELKYVASINYPDTSLVYKSWEVKLYTNDTIVRVETETDALGTQIYIRNMQLEKAYLLLDVQEQKFAIQTDLTKKQNSDSSKTAYTFKKKFFGGKTINGLKCKKYHIVYSESIEFDCYFAKGLSNKYLEVYRNIPGLAVDYFIPNEDGLIHYQLVEQKSVPVNRNLFGIPSDYKRVSFEEFMKAIGME